MRFHGVCDLFPEMSDEEFKELVADVKTRGVQVPVATYQGSIIDGKHRWKACQELGITCPTVEWDGTGSLTEHVVSLNLRRRHLTQSQKACVAVAMLPLLETEAAERRGTRTDLRAEMHGSPGRAAEHAAAAVGVSPRYVAEAKALLRDDPEVFTAAKRGERTLTEARKDIRAKAREVARTTIPDDLPQAISDRCTLLTSDIASADVADGSLDWIITDPPYPQEFLPCYDALEAFAATKLKLTGSLLCMIGQSYLPDILRRLCRGRLHYRWTIAYLTPGGQAVQLWQRKVNTFWKPVLLFTRDAEDAGAWFGDVCRSETNDNDKRFHGWGQSESGMLDLMKRFVKPGDLVCDPFLGGGTTALVALSLNCRFLGIDIDAEAVKTTRGRLNDVAR